MIMAWQCISPEATVREFKKCCMSSVQSDMLQNDSEEAGSGNRECEKDEGTNCEDGHFADNMGREVDCQFVKVDGN
jgi:hypothetical protein